MIGSLSKRFDVSIEHRASATATHSVPGPMNIQPFRGRFFAAADLVAHVCIENFRAPAGDRPQAGFTKKLKGFWNRHSEDPLREVTNLNGGERLDMQIRIKGAQAPQ